MMLKVNEYFNGNVKSIAFASEEGPATVGVMVEGEYEFGTSTKEIMVVTTGKIAAKLPGSEDWKEYGPFERFEVEAGRKFRVRVAGESSYVCFYK